MKKNCFIYGISQCELDFGENSTACDILKDKIAQKLIEVLSEEDDVNFITMMRPGADTFAAAEVLRLKKDYPLITLECMIPYEEQAADWDECARDRYFDIIERCDKETLFSTSYRDNVEDECLNKARKRADEVIYISHDLDSCVCISAKTA